MKKSLCILLTLVLLAVTCACKPPRINENVADPNKTPLYIAIGDNGVGTEFLYDLEKAYEAYNPEVDVVINQRDSELSNGLEYIKTATEDIIYVNSEFTFTQYGNYVLDLTDMTASKAYDENGAYVGMGNGTKSLQDKMMYYENGFNLVNQGTKEDPRFLGLPWFSAIYGLWYDMDLFDTENLYDLPEYTGFDGVANTGDEYFGPDGKEGTYDDGLPATWEDMKALLQVMKEKGIVPFTFSGMHSWMRNFWLDVILMNYEGMSDYTLCYTFDGTDSDFGEINADNGYLLKQQEGKKATLMVAEKIAKDKLYSTPSLYTTQTHLQAQIDFLDSVTTDSASAFLIDGSWWEYEARDTFADMSKQNPNFARGKRRFGYFPIPRFVGTEGLKDQVNTQQYINSISNFMIAANAKTKVPDVVQDFLLFSHSEENLINFTKTTNLFCLYEYDMSNDLDSLTPLAQSVYDLMRDENVVIYFSGKDALTMNGYTATQAQNCLRAKNNTFFENWDFLTKVGNMNYMDAIRDMAFDEKNELTAATWFEGLGEACSKSTWDKYFG